MKMNSIAVKVKGLTVTFPSGGEDVRPVRDVDIVVRQGETFGLVGESGSGKSLTVSSIANILPDTAAASWSEMEIAGLTLSSQTDAQWRKVRKEHIGFVFQNPMTALNPLFTVRRQLFEAIPAPDVSGSESKEVLAIRLLESVGIRDPREKLGMYSHELSGGTAQRVIIAMALAGKPELLIADEPTTALDVSVQAQVLKLLKQLSVDYNLAIIFVSHDLHVISECADQVAVMQNGQIVEQGTTEQVMTRPKHSYTRKLIEATPRAIGLRPSTSEPSSASSLPVYAVEAVSKRYFRNQIEPAVDQVSLNIYEGQSVGIIGESGSGKTTLARMLVGLEVPTSGVIRYKGADIQGMSSAQLRSMRSEVKFVFQDNTSALDPRMSIGESVLQGLHQVRGLSRRDREQKLRRALDEVGLSAALIDRRPYALSGGQRQRVGFARALISDPRVIIADEPVSALDVSVQATVLNMINEIKREREITFIMITHDLRVVDSVCDTIVTFQNGQIAEMGDRSEVLLNPRNAYTKQLLDALPGNDALM